MIGAPLMAFASNADPEKDFLLAASEVQHEQKYTEGSEETIGLKNCIVALIP
jgi:hypothetical protein